MQDVRILYTCTRTDSILTPKVIDIKYGHIAGIGDIMKTSVEIDKEKSDRAKKLGNISTLKELIDLALDAYIAQCRREQMLSLLGTDFFEGDLDKMRKRPAAKKGSRSK